MTRVLHRVNIGGNGVQSTAGEKVPIAVFVGKYLNGYLQPQIVLTLADIFKLSYVDVVTISLPNAAASDQLRAECQHLSTQKWDSMLQNVTTDS